MENLLTIARLQQAQVCLELYLEENNLGTDENPTPKLLNKIDLIIADCIKALQQ